jgi:hypothetical protein
MSEKFSGSSSVTSRNPLIHNGATNATRSRLSDSEEAPPCRTRVLGAELDGSLATLNFRELLFFPRTSVNRVRCRPYGFTHKLFAGNHQNQVSLR